MKLIPQIMNISESPVAISLLVLIGIVGIYFISFNPNRILKFALHPFSVVYRRKYYLLLTNIFIHSNYTHLLFNLLTFYFFALQLEITIGSLHFLIIFIFSGLVSSIPSTLKNRNNYNYFSLGASGAISGIIFSYILFYPTSRLYVFFIPIGIPAPLFALLYLAYCIFAARQPNSEINHEAHFWGAISGLILTIVLFPESLSFFFRILKVVF